MEQVFFALVDASDAPFFAVFFAFSALVGVTFAAVLTFAAAVGSAVSICRKLRNLTTR